jgi:hypothetical protein
VKVVCDRLKVERAHFVGHSLGTIVCLHLAVLHPRLVRSLALFGPLLAPPDAARPNIAARGVKARSEGVAGMQAIAEAIVQAATSSDTKAHKPVTVALVRESLMRQDPEGYARSCEALAAARPVDPALIKAPTLLVTGEDDAVAPPQSGARARRPHLRLARRGVPALRPLDHLRTSRGVRARAARIPRVPTEIERRPAMANVLFSNVRIFDGSGAQPYAGDVLVQGNRVSRVSKGVRSISAAGLTTVDGNGATLMPGMVEAHTHFAWNDHPASARSSACRPRSTSSGARTWPKRYLDMGWTSCVGPATAKPRLDVVIRNAIESGQIPGPRYLAASQEITVLGGLGDETLPHLPYPEFSFGAIVSGVEEMRRPVRMLPEVRRRYDQAQPLGRVHRGIAGGIHADDGRRGGESRSETKLRGKRLAGPRALQRIRSSSACATASTSIFHASFTDSKGSTCSRPRRTASSWRRPRLARQHLLPRRKWACTPDAMNGDGLSPRARGRRRVAQEDARSAASASCPAATTASRGPRTAATRRTSSTS